ncbi:MAG: type II/IV secretion system protein [Kiritimatiellae bacterium]|nr:type II/IV secretion system protein [Kiritimatiellia bacterium]
MLSAADLLMHADRISDPVGLVDRILRAGLLMRASDVHFDPFEGYVRVRFRIDGELEEVLRIPSTMQSAVTGRLKVLASLDIAERRAPQDGGFSWRMNIPGAPFSGPLDIRMATLPVRHGERITLRLLEVGGKRFTLDDIGLSGSARSVVDGVLARPQGLVLLTGPTGSGKTTTLYAFIGELLKGSPKNIMTVEDPVEYEIPGVSQAEVDSSDKVNFDKALKSILRHDPDVVMIGEIRDAQSLDVAIKSALTGHLVLSTLHANGAIAAVTRLRNMGLANHLISATLRLSIAQRLVRTVCKECSGKGCGECSGRGTKGRTGVFEIFKPDAETSRLIADGASEERILEEARKSGFVLLAEDVRSKVAAGLTTEAEAIKVAFE